MLPPPTIRDMRVRHNSNGIVYENGPWVGSRRQNKSKIVDFRYQSPKIGLFDIKLAFKTPKF